MIQKRNIKIQSHAIYFIYNVSNIRYIWTAINIFDAHTCRSQFRSSYSIQSFSSIAYNFYVWFRNMRFKDGFGALAFFLLLFFYFIVVSVIIIIFLYVCCAFLIYCTLDSFYIFFVYSLRIPIIYSTHPKKPVRIYQVNSQCNISRELNVNYH